MTNKTIFINKIVFIKYIKCTTWWTGIHFYTLEVITTTKLINTFSTSHCYYFFWCGENTRATLLANFKYTIQPHSIINYTLLYINYIINNPWVEDLPSPGTELISPASTALQADSLLLNRQGSPTIQRSINYSLQSYTLDPQNLLLLYRKFVPFGQCLVSPTHSVPLVTTILVSGSEFNL